jgi:3'-phosphoadenosine 5'-phosphosulfate sulfotransferase (PAPS reductase)/FAD synthetase
MRVLSLGWGVQSFTLAAMAALGDIEPIAAAVHSDTTWERQATYKYAAMMTSWLEERGVRVVTVSNPQPVNELLSFKTDLPSYTISEDGEVFGQLRRQCTGSWKIEPMRRWLQANRNKQPVDSLLGISMDEWHRAKDSDVKYITHRFPLLDLKMTRGDCIAYLQGHNLPVPVKSSCVFCPYHNKRAWQDMKREGGEDWKKAVEVDEQIRNVRPPYLLFVHSARKPLPEAVRIPEDEGAVQLTMLDDTPCDSGYCFL